MNHSLSIAGKIFLSGLVLAGIFACCLLSGAGGFGWPDTTVTAGRAVLDARLVRLVTGFIVGAGLSCAGCALQAVLRNPLAEPYVLGVSGGGAFGAAAALISGLPSVHPVFLPVSAFLSASATLAWVWALARRVGGGYRPSVLILTGVVTGSILSSLLLLLLSFAPDRAVHGVMWWLLGNLQTGSWPMVWTGGTLVTLAFLILLVESRTLNVLLLGRDAAYYAGVRLHVEIPLILGAATLAAAASVALSGVIGFVGLIVPHAVRRLVGANHQTLLPCAFFYGGGFLILCDTLSRVVAIPREIPVGVVTSLLGGPFFLSLLCRRGR